jgi:phospholipase A-2-activating protein
MEYLDQVVGFIEKNSGGVKVQSSQQFVDPYTGTYNSQLTLNFPHQLSNALSGASRYQASPAVASSGNASSYVDPFTGSSRYAPPSSTPVNAAPTPPPPKPANSILPVVCYVGLIQTVELTLS